jgi:hypothetical protein
MNYPLHLTFKILAIAPQVRVTDSSGAPVLYVKQKILKLKEHVEVFTDDTKTNKLCDIRADKVIDWSAAYHFTDSSGTTFGGVRRQGGRSLWRAHYEIFENSPKDPAEFTIREENGMVKVMDGIVGGIPIIGAFAGYFFNPSYLVTRPDGTPVIRMKKQPAFLEGKFTVEKLGELDTQEQGRTLTALLMMLMLERQRG